MRNRTRGLLAVVLAVAVGGWAAACTEPADSAGGAAADGATTTAESTTTTPTPSTTTTVPLPRWPDPVGGSPGAVTTPTGVVAAVLRDNGDGSYLVRAPCGGEATVRGTPIAPVHVVLDAGHGGEEPGAVGPAGTLEKAVNLAIAEETKRQLEALGAWSR